MRPGGYQRDLEKEESLMPLRFSSKRTGYLGDLLVRKHAVLVLENPRILK